MKVQPEQHDRTRAKAAYRHSRSILGTARCLGGCVRTALIVPLLSVCLRSSVGSVTYSRRPFPRCSFWRKGFWLAHDDDKPDGLDRATSPDGPAALPVQKDIAVLVAPFSSRSCPQRMMNSRAFQGRAGSLVRTKSLGEIRPRSWPTSHACVRT